MKHSNRIFYRSNKGALATVTLGVIATLFFMGTAVAAGVVARGSTNTTNTARVSATRATNATARMPSAASTNASAPATTTTTTESAPEPTPDPVIENKSGQFGAMLGTNTTTSGTFASDNFLAESIARQRAAQNAADAVSAAVNSAPVISAAGTHPCDTGLRSCMQAKCGADYSKCAGDGDTIWGDKMDLCRRDVECTGNEYAQFTREIKADRDMNARLSAYNAVINCGNRYNDCIITQCGTTFNKCLGKPAGDAAIKTCDAIAKECIQQDSGMPARAMEVMATLRQDAEKQIQRDTERLYSLRDDMSKVCSRLGAMFDQRSLDCVFTVNLYAGGNTTLYASKKLYAGGAFDCTQNWFGIDITTYRENAYRETRAQKSASNAMLGSGIGAAVGMVTSGAMDRALDRQKANKELKKAKNAKDDEEKGGKGSSSDAGSGDSGTSGGKGKTKAGDDEVNCEEGEEDCQKEKDGKKGEEDCQEGDCQDKEKSGKEAEKDDDKADKKADSKDNNKKDDKKDDKKADSKDNKKKDDKKAEPKQKKEKEPKQKKEKEPKQKKEKAPKQKKEKASKK